MDDFVFLKGPLVDSTIKLSGINLSKLDVGQFKKLVESRSNISPQEFDLVYGGRILKDEKTATEYKVISGTTLFVLKKFITEVKSECVGKTETVRCPEFSELLRHERMQDLIVTVLITDPDLVEQLLAENEEDVSNLSQLRTLLRSRHFIGLLRSSTFEVFSNSPELLTLGQRIIDKCISDIRSQGQEIPNSDTQLIVTLEQYLSVDYMEEEEGNQQSSQENTSNQQQHALVPSIITVPPQQPPPPPSQRTQPQGLFTVEMLTNALQGSATSSPVADPPSYSAEQSRSPPAGNFSQNDIREALAGAYRTQTQSSTSYHSHHHRRSGYETNRRTGHSSTRREGDREPYREQQRERRGSNRRERQETQRRQHYPELSPDRTTYLRQTYRNELEQLKLLGIQDELLAVQVLQATEGDVNSAVEILLQS